MNKSTLVLFNAIQVKSELPKGHSKNKEILKRCFQNGYILDKCIRLTDKLLDEIESVIGISGEKANTSFHKSWGKVQDTPMEQLVLEQMMHYLTTYGYEAMGIDGPTFIPVEELNIPDVKRIPITFIKGLTSLEILEKIVKLGTSVALKQDTLDHIMKIVVANDYNSIRIRNNFSYLWLSEITNRELKTLLMEHYDLVPSEPVEFLRYIITKLTGNSLLIKSGKLISELGEPNKVKTRNLDRMLKSAPTDLASIFYRFKPLFLALKKVSNNKRFFNRLRKDAKKQHVPMPVDYLNDVTNQLKKGELDLRELTIVADRSSIFRKIRLAYALNYRLNNPTSIVYKVRNGKGFAKEFSWNGEVGLGNETTQTLHIVLESIIDDLTPKVFGKLIYIPSNVHYALPATEKQFMGNFPSGTYISVPEDAIIGIHWTNTDTYSVDLDIATISVNGKMGWDGGYRDEELLFSGDIVTAPLPNGATELFYIKKELEHSNIMTVNYYNFNEDQPVDCKVLIAHEKADEKRFVKKNYMVDPNNIIAQANIVIDKKETTLGLIKRVDNETRLYFSNVSTGNKISSRGDEISNLTRNYFETSVSNPLLLNDLLKKAGAKIIDNRDDIPQSTEYLDLSPEALDKNTIIDIMR